MGGPPICASTPGALILPHRRKIHRLLSFGKSLFRERSGDLEPRYVVHSLRSFSRTRKYTLCMRFE
jgi:hypothetical protein